MMVKSGLEFILKLTEPLQRYLLSCQANLAILGRYFCTGQQQLWRGSVNFKINSRPLFTIIFKLKNGNFMTRDFSPLIKRVLAGVRVSHSKVNKVILLCWGYRFGFLLMFWVVSVHEIGTFMSNLSVFTNLMMRAIYGSIWKIILLLSEFWIIGSFRSHFQALTSNKPAKG